MIPGAGGGACPCGGVPSGAPLSACCGPYLAGDGWPGTPEALMRSRYTAYAVGDTDHLFRTWHPGTRPADVEVDRSVRWSRLEIVDVGGDDTEGVVEFAAHWTSGDSGTRQDGVMRERSTFARRAGRWVYRDGVDRAV